MKGFNLIFNPEEEEYARKVAAFGAELPSEEGKHYYTVYLMKLTSHLPGMVKIACVVETEKQRDIKLGMAQDFGMMKIVFYALFNNDQVEILAKRKPEIVCVKIENEGGASILSWPEYKHLVSEQ